MMQRYNRSGKQITQDGKHFADAADETAAAMIVNALMALEEASDRRAAIMGLREPRWGDGGVVTQHTRRREADEYACSCGLRWAVDEDDPH